MRPCLIVKVGSTMPDLAARRGDYEDWIAAGLDGVGVEICDVRAGDPLPEPGRVRGVVVTGSSALVTDREPWSEKTGRWLVEVATQQTPLLAICYGHQLLADVLGGSVGANAHGREMGAIEVALNDAATEDPLFSVLPRRLRMSSSHRQSVLRLPDGARLLASNAATVNQAYALGPRAWGVQFHPEWDHEVIRAYLEARREVLRDEGFDPEGMLEEVEPCDHGVRLLGRFAELI